MSEISATSYALTGIQNGLAGARKNAEEIARAGTRENPHAEDFIKPAVELKQNTLQVQASTAVLKAVDEAVGTLFDETA